MRGHDVPEKTFNLNALNPLKNIIILFKDKLNKNWNIFLKKKN
jgi:hypothetical protein